MTQIHPHKHTHSHFHFRLERTAVVRNVFNARSLVKHFLRFLLVCCRRTPKHKRWDSIVFEPFLILAGSKHPHPIHTPGDRPNTIILTFSFLFLLIFSTEIFILFMLNCKY